MPRIAAVLAIVLFAGSTVRGAEDPRELLDRFLARIKADLHRLPDYVCNQTVERFARISADRPWQRVDRLRLEVAMIGDKELYAPEGSGALQDRPLAEMVRRGTIVTGKLGLLARHVFLGSRARFTYRYETEEEGRRVHEFDYEVPVEQSGYQVRSSRGEATVAFQGSFRFDHETAELRRLDVIAADIPDRLGLAEANVTLQYAPVRVDNAEVVLPLAGTLSVVALDGTEDLNRTRLEGCRRYQAAAEIRFEDRAPAAPVTELAEGEETDTAPALLPKGAILELELDQDLDPASARVDDPVRARLAKPLVAGDREILPAGSMLFGRLTRLASEALPFPRYELGLEFDTLDTGKGRFALVATLQDAGPAAGLLRQSKRLDPTFTKRRSARLNILVHEVQRGQGILLWDARRGALRSGLRMRWRVEEDVREPATQELAQLP